jgi:site-specific DNA-methyltransferase (adenine-specific)
VAKKLGRRYLGFELSEDYAEGVRRRLELIEHGEGLRYREPVSVPRGPGVRRTRAAGLKPR